MRFKVQSSTGTHRLIALGVVGLLHVLLVWALLSQSGFVRTVLPALMVTHIARAHRVVEPPPIRPIFTNVEVPQFLPEIAVAAPAKSAARAMSLAAPVSHFGAAEDAGLGVDVAGAVGGGTAARGSLGDFEAAVKAAILAQKRQPFLAADRRNTCVVNYRVSITASGAIDHFAIDPCAEPEINAAAEAAIKAAAPFPVPPDLGAASTEVRGTLIFKP